MPEQHIYWEGDASFQVEHSSPATSHCVLWSSCNGHSIVVVTQDHELLIFNGPGAPTPLLMSVEGWVGDVTQASFQHTDRIVLHTNTHVHVVHIPERRVMHTVEGVYNWHMLLGGDILHVGNRDDDTVFICDCRRGTTQRLNDIGPHYAIDVHRAPRTRRLCAYTIYAKRGYHFVAVHNMDTNTTVTSKAAWLVDEYTVLPLVWGNDARRLAVISKTTVHVMRVSDLEITESIECRDFPDDFGCACGDDDGPVILKWKEPQRITVHCDDCDVEVDEVSVLPYVPESVVACAATGLHREHVSDAVVDNIVC